MTYLASVPNGKGGVGDLDVREPPSAVAAPPSSHLNPACRSERREASVVYFGIMELSGESSDRCLLDGGSE